jgi:hypothetical protein
LESITVGLRVTLAAAYGLADAELDRVANGQSTLNYAGTAGGRPIFVKRYPTDTDLHAERHALTTFLVHPVVPACYARRLAPVRAAAVSG